jgi:hypothetical protein
MSKISKILLDGTYHHVQDEINYFQENFKLVHNLDPETYHIYSELTSRLETGEFLKILVSFEMNQYYYPTFARIEKSIGNKYAQEIFRINTLDHTLHYSFQNSQTTQDFKKTIGPKHFITTPSASTAAIFTLSKKILATGRTPIILLSSGNDWKYESPPIEKTVFAKMETSEVTDFNFNGSPLQASHLRLFENDLTQPDVADPTEFYISRHFAIAYLIKYRNTKIAIKTLKKNNP